MIDKPLTVAGLAELLDVSESWVQKKCAARAIPFTKIARQIRFTEDHVRQILAAGEQTPITTSVSVVQIRSRRVA